LQTTEKEKEVPREKVPAVCKGNSDTEKKRHRQSERRVLQKKRETPHTSSGIGVGGKKSVPVPHLSEKRSKRLPTEKSRPTKRLEIRKPARYWGTKPVALTIIAASLQR